MVEVLNWLSDNWIFALFSWWFLFYGLECLIRAWRGNEK